MVEIVSLKLERGFVTEGLSRDYGFELRASIKNENLIAECERFVRSIVSYILSGSKLKSGDTIEYGYWLTKAIMSPDGEMSFWEYNSAATEFVCGLDNTLFYWQGQHEICTRVGAVFSPPRADRMIVISEGVYEGDSVDGVRYPSPAHMSGWWLTTKRYNGDIRTLKAVHAYHVSANRPDLSKFLALPYGYRFSSSDNLVWFDEDISIADP